MMRWSALSAMFLIACLNAYLKYWGDWNNFAGILLFQILMISTLHSYLFNKTIRLGVKSFAPDEDPAVRKLMTAIATFAYFFLFLRN